MMNNSYC